MERIVTAAAPGRKVTIITWHYVRDGAPAGLHARSVGEFAAQLDHIAATYTPLTLDTVAAAARDPQVALPPNACLLTFDDGYRDHFETVFPMLVARGWQGVFFPVVRAAKNGAVLDVNKIQFAIASAGLAQIAAETRDAIDAGREAFGLADSATLYRELATAGLHNPPEAMFVKRALQTALPAPLRARICAEIFARHVSADEADFAAKLYANTDELREMYAGGMALGGHGDRHNRMNALDTGQRSDEYQRSRAFLDSLGIPTAQGWSFCYPYGAHDASVVEGAAAAGCTAAFTLEPRIADLARDNILALPRIDTNSLPLR
jgi:peptidoglycan/xylan/chitin deacetylase (PgdA/CDA1 family)